MQIVFDAAPIHLSPSLPHHSTLTPPSLLSFLTHHSPLPATGSPLKFFLLQIVKDFKRIHHSSLISFFFSCSLRFAKSSKSCKYPASRLVSQLITHHSTFITACYRLSATCSLSQSMVCLRIPIKSIKCNEQLKKQSKLLATRYMLKKQQRQQKQHVAQPSFVPLTPLSLPSHFSFLTPYALPNSYLNQWCACEYLLNQLNAMSN